MIHHLKVEAAKRDIRRIARHQAYDMVKKREFLGTSDYPRTTTQWGKLRRTISQLPNDFESGSSVFIAWLGKKEVPEDAPEEPPKTHDNSQEDSNTKKKTPKDPWPDRRQKAWGTLREQFYCLASKETAIWQYYEENDNVKFDDQVKSALWGFAVRHLLDYMCEAFFDEMKKNAGKR
ncbi:MAG: hypothetical protein GX130_08600 [Candidatus Hydrogenedens sp.]|nr:hypothetical protein [Candidatus Hydrogenedens sp.]